MNWTFKHVLKDIEFLPCFEIITQVMLNCFIIKAEEGKQKVDMIIKVILKSLEGIFEKYEKNITSSGLIYILGIYRKLREIHPNFQINDKEFPKTFIAFNQENFFREVIYKDENTDFSTGIYSKALSPDSFSDSVTASKWKDCMKKFEDFSGSLKNCFNLNNSKMNFEKNIEDFKAGNGDNNMDKNAFQKFYLNCTIDMFTEIFNQGQ